LGQTGWTKSTLQHIAAADYDTLLLPGDLSYADFIQTRWDSYGRLVQPLASAWPWMVTQGNHEVERHSYATETREHDVISRKTCIAFF
jgi:acid phosphatase type 7